MREQIFCSSPIKDLLLGILEAVDREAENKLKDKIVDNYELERLILTGIKELQRKVDCYERQRKQDLHELGKLSQTDFWREPSR
jgi:hypothetical protein